MKRLGWWVFDHVPLHRFGLAWFAPVLFGWLIGARGKRVNDAP
jgi:hypothetical protein